jgi:DivIVA domain-containing protein
MVYTPAEIHGNRFPIRIRGYRTEAVESFLARLAADYQLLLDATSELTETDYHLKGLRALFEEVSESAEKEISAAEREARRLTQQTLETVARIHEQAAEEALAIKASAIQEAETLLTAAELLGRSAKIEAREVRECSDREVAQAHDRVTEERETVLGSARERAANILRDAERYAQELMRKTQQEVERLYKDSTLQLAALQSYEVKSTLRFAEMRTLLERLTHLVHDAAHEALALEHDAVRIHHGKRFPFLEPREVELATMARVMNAPAQQTVDVFAALLRDLGYMLNQVVARKQKDGDANVPRRSLILSDSVGAGRRVKP